VKKARPDRGMSMQIGSSPSSAGKQKEYKKVKEDTLKQIEAEKKILQRSSTSLEKPNDQTNSPMGSSINSK
jgi:hypothetical protein